MKNAGRTRAIAPITENCFDESLFFKAMPRTTVG